MAFQVLSGFNSSQQQDLAKRVEDNLALTEDIISMLYRALSEDLVPEGHALKVALDKTMPNSYSFRPAHEFISDFYSSDSHEYHPSEFEAVHMALALELGNICAQCILEHKKREEGSAKNIESSMTDICNGVLRSLKGLYPNPNDLIFEYEQFRQWHEQEPESAKGKGLSYFIEQLWNYTYFSARKALLPQNA